MSQVGGNNSGSIANGSVVSTNGSADRSAYTYVPPTTTVQPKPYVAPAVPVSNAATTVKVATSNLLILDEKKDITDLIADAIIEDIGGQEIINLTRNDLLNGETVNYSVISNLTSTAEAFNSNTFIKVQGTDADYFGNFAINLGSYVPEFGTEVATDGTQTGNIAYVDKDTGKVIINTVFLSEGYKVEVEFITYGEALTDTSY